MRALLASALLLGLTGTACAAECSPLQIENSIKMVPLNRSNRFLVPITLNGVEKKFLFDTAGALSTISQSAVKELNLPAYHSRYRLSNTRGQDSWDFVQVHDVSLGNAKSNGVQLQIVDKFGPPGGPEPYDGTLASGIFLHDDFDLDFGAERLNFFSPDHCDGKVIYWPHQVLSVIPIKEEQGHLDIPVTLDGHPMRAVINTAAPNTSLRLNRAREILNFSPDAPTTGNAPKDNPEKQIYPRRFASLSFDGVTVQNPLIIIQPLEYGGGKDDDTVVGSRAEHKDDQLNRLSADMVIGMDILRHLHIYVASRESKLYVTEATPGESVLFKPAAASANKP
jgi:predicted aspartyl protease